MKCDAAQKPRLNTDYDVVKSRLQGERRQATRRITSKWETVLCWAVAKDTSMQGGSHGDRCVRQPKAE